MTVTIELKPETEKILAARARRENLKIETYLETFIEKNLNGESEAAAEEKKKSCGETATTEERLAEFRRWLDSREDKGLPYLSDEATGRENIYEDRF